MRTVRRLYFYVLALIGIQAVIWGAINLLRTIISSGIAGGGANLMATGLSLVLVGLPVFLLHWLVAQRDARRDEEEHVSRIRAIFLYASLVWTLIPILYSLLAVINRQLAVWMGLSTVGVWFGSGASASDNLVSIVINLCGMVYFAWVLHKDWQAGLRASFLPETRRLYRYLWMLFGLTVMIFGIQGVLRYLLSIPEGLDQNMGYLLANSTALALVGAAVWAYFWLSIQNELREPGEKISILRLVVLYIINLAGVVGVLAAGGNVLTTLFQGLLGRTLTLTDFMTSSANPLAALVPLGLTWAYFGRILEQEMASLADQPRRAGVRRLYRSLLSALGLAVTFTGILTLTTFFVDQLYYGPHLYQGWASLASGLAALVVAMPLWLSNWVELQKEAAERSDTGDRTRRSVIRRAYLYLFIFILVVGGMGVAADLFFNVLSNLLGSTVNEIGLLAAQRLQMLAVIAVFLIYHLRALRQDGRVAAQALGALHASFPVLMLADADLPLVDEMKRVLQRLSPSLPLVVHPLNDGVLSEDLLSTKLLVLPAASAVQPPEGLRAWLDSYRGRRMILPLPLEGWIWLGSAPRTTREMAQEAAASIVQLAEGEAPRAALPSNPWSIVGYILGGLFALPLLIGLFALLVNSLYRM